MTGFIVKTDRRAVSNALARLKASLGDLRPALRNAANELTRRVYYRFTTKRDPDGRRWAPWAKSTAERYSGQKRTLMLHTKALRSGSRFIPGRSDLRAVLGTDYGVFHEQPYGDSSRLPRRAFMFANRNGRRGLALKDEQYLVNALRYQLRKSSRA